MVNIHQLIYCSLFLSQIVSINFNEGIQQKMYRLPREFKKNPDTNVVLEHDLLHLIVQRNNQYNLLSSEDSHNAAS